MVVIFTPYIEQSVERLAPKAVMRVNNPDRTDGGWPVRGSLNRVGFDLILAGSGWFNVGAQCSRLRWKAILIRSEQG